MRHRKLRSWLTILGIVIGIASIIALIGISQGMQNAIKEQFESFGPNRIIISAKGFQGPGSSSEGLTEDDVDTVESIKELKYVQGILARTAEIKKRGEVRFTQIMGIPSEDFKEAYSDIGHETSEGRYFIKGEKGVAVIGSRVAEEMFNQELRVKNKIEINGEGFRIIGVMEAVGNRQDDNAIIIPLESARDIFDEPEAVDFIMAQAKPGINIPLLQEKVERRLKRARDDENFQVMTASQILEQINQILGVVQIVLVGIAGISLLVGGIGIMNSMYTGVLERTREVGIMKAIGARNSDILMMFLVESGVQGLIGGAFGVAIGIGIAKIVGMVAQASGFIPLKIEIGIGLILFGLGFAFVVGMISGALPASKASKLRPVEALRYE